jgi:hypothetical protein
MLARSPRDLGVFFRSQRGFTTKTPRAQVAQKTQGVRGCPRRKSQKVFTDCTDSTDWDKPEDLASLNLRNL